MAEVGSAYVSILPSARGFGSKLDSAITPGIGASGKKAGKTWGGTFGSVVKGTLAGLGIAKIGSEAIQFLGDSLAEGREAEKVGARTANVIKSMGLESKVTEGQISALSTAISNKAGIDDEAIQSGANMLLTFKNVADSAGTAGGVFEKTTGLVVDMSAAMGKDMQSSSVMLGKALNDPVKGLTALTRVGVQFSDQQKKQIEGFVENGEIAKAQGVILEEVGKQFGGAAEAMATPSEKARVAVDNLKEQIGTGLIPVVNTLATLATTTLIPAISGFVSVVGSVVGFIDRNRTAVLSLVGALTVLVAITKVHAAVMAVQAAGGLLKYLSATKLVTSATKAYAAVQWILNAALTANPIGIVVVALAALVVGIIIAYKKSETFRDAVTASFRAVGNAGRWLWNNALAPAFRFIIDGIGTIIEGAADMLDALSHVPGFGWAKDAADKMHGAADAAHAVADGIKDIPSSKTVSVNIMVNTSAIAKAEAQLDRFTAHAANSFPRSPVKEGPLRAFNKYGGVGGALMHSLERGIEEGGPRSDAALKKHLDKLKDRFESLKDAAKSLAESIAGAFTEDVFSGTLADFFTTAQQNIFNLTSMKAALKQLKGFGASDSFIKALFASGNSILISQLAAGGKSTVAAAQSLFGAQNALSAQLGGRVAGTVLGDEVRGVRKEIRELRRDLRHSGKENAREFARVLNSSAAAASRSNGGRWEAAWA